MNSLLKDIENIGLLKLTQKGIDFLKIPHSVEIIKDLDYSDVDEIEDESNEVAPGVRAGNSYDKILFDLP